MFFKLLSKFLLRMSLAMYAAPFDNDSSDYKNNDNDNEDDEDYSDDDDTMGPDDLSDLDDFLGSLGIDRS